MPSAVLGHSLGEYAASNVAGVLYVTDTIFLVGRRADFVGNYCTAETRSLLAIVSSVNSIRQFLTGELEIACINGPRETVLGGPNEVMKSYSKTIKTAGIKSVVVSLCLCFPFGQSVPILEPLRELSDAITFGEAAVPVISPMLRGMLNGGDTFGPDYLARHTRETVDFISGISAAREQGLVDKSTIWIEIGPTPVCSAFLKSSLGAEIVTVPTLRKKEDPWKPISSGLSILHLKGLPIDWEEVNHEYESSHIVLALPSYAFENKNYWLEYTNNWCLNKRKAIETPTKTSGDRLSTSSVQRLSKED